MDTGVTQITDGGDSFRIFDIEKTVVDIIYYRNKIGIEETTEVLRNNLKLCEYLHIQAASHPRLNGLLFCAKAHCPK